MAATQFVPLTGQLIDEGDFLKRLDKELADLSDTIVRFCHEHGAAALKCKGELNIKLALKIENPEDLAVSLKISMKPVPPQPPATVSMVMGGVHDDGKKMALFVRASGSDRSHPKQLKLATHDGRIIDQDTGEVLD